MVDDFFLALSLVRWWWNERKDKKKVTFEYESYISLVEQMLTKDKCPYIVRSSILSWSHLSSSVENSCITKPTHPMCIIHNEFWSTDSQWKWCKSNTVLSFLYMFLLSSVRICVYVMSDCKFENNDII